MSKYTSIIRPFVFIRRNRFRKKMSFYKMAIRLMVDLTTAIYLLLVGGYVIASLFIMGDVMERYQHYFEFAENQAINRYWLFVCIVPLRYITRSFTDPGIIFSSSEYQLGNLPFAREKVWLLSVAEKWAKRLVSYIIIGLLLIAITPIASRVVIAYMLMFFIMDLLMTVPQWLLFQGGILKKLGWTCVSIVLLIIALLTNPLIVSLMLTISILIVNFSLYRFVFQSVHWGKVTEVSDFKIWNMWLIGKATNSKFKRQKKHGLFHNSTGQKKPFLYQSKYIQHRLWRIYFRKNMDLILQVIGALFILLLVLLFASHLAFHIGVAIAIYVYTSIAASFFCDRFQTDIVEVLPWDLKRYQQSFLKWIAYGSVSIIIPIVIFTVIHGTIWSIVQLLFYTSTFLFMYRIKINKAIAVLSKQTGYFDPNSLLGWLFLILIAVSGLYPFISLSFIIVSGILLLSRTSEQKS